MLFVSSALEVTLYELSLIRCEYKAIMHDNGANSPVASIGRALPIGYTNFKFQYSSSRLRLSMSIYSYELENLRLMNGCKLGWSTVLTIKKTSTLQMSRHKSVTKDFKSRQ
jgi:hypothetical protein